MRKRGKRRRAAVVPAIALLLLATGRAGAETQLIVNGGFESGGGSLASWTVASQPGSDGAFSPQSGAFSPISGTSVPPPPGGTFAAMSDGEGPGSRILYQDFVVPTPGIVSAVLSFDRFVGNRAGAFFTPGSLDFTLGNNQQARVDLVSTLANPFSLAAGDLIRNVFRTEVGDPLVSGYSTVTVDLTSVLATRAGESLRLRFAEVDNQFLFQFGVDNVSLLVQVIPEPGSLALLGVGLLGLLGHGWRRRLAP